MNTAILIDGSFFLKRYISLFRNGRQHSPEQRAENMYRMALKHLQQKHTTYELYRIFYYDCLPFSTGVHNPVSKKFVDFSRTTFYQERLAFLDELKKKRKLALRLGQLKTTKNWLISPKKIKELLSIKICIDELTDNDIKLELRQKGVDIKIGLDIASPSKKEWCLKSF